MSALLWFLFLSLSTAEAIYEAMREPVYFPAGRSLFPQWPVWHPRWALTLLATTAIILFLPKLLSALVIIIKGRAREFSGMVKLLASVFLEVLFSTLFAPVRMMFHSKFVFVTLMGQQVGWGGQQRSDLGTSWGEALRLHGAGTAFAFVWAAVLFLVNRSFFWWNTPIFIPLLLSIPFSVWSSRASMGRAFRRMGLFVIPEEVSPPPVLQCLENILQGEKSLSLPRIPDGQGFARAVADPQVNLLHRSLLRTQRKLSPAIANRRRELLEKAFAQGPESLSVREKKELLYDPQCLQELHWRVWEAAGQASSAQWGLASA